MSDEPDNIMLVYLRRMDIALGSVTKSLGEVRRDLSMLRIDVAGVRRDIAQLSEAQAIDGLRHDSTEERLNRVEWRLDLLPGPAAR